MRKSKKKSPKVENEIPKIPWTLPITILRAESKLPAATKRRLRACMKAAFDGPAVLSSKDM